MVAAIMKWLRVVVDALVEVIVVPIREGAPRPRSWPAGLRLVMGLVAVGYLLGLGLVLGAPLLRQFDNPVIIDGAEVIGGATLTLLTWLVSLTLAVSLTAVLHVNLWLRVVALILLLAPLSSLIGIPGRGWLALAGATAIVVFFLIRARGRFAAWEFAIIWILTSLALLGPLRWEINIGYDQRTVTLLLVLLTMNSLAVPALLLTGYAASQITTTLAQWVGFRSAEMLPRTVVTIGMWVLVAANLAHGLWQSIGGAPGWGLTQWAGAGVLASLTVVSVVIPLSRLPGGRMRRQQVAASDPDALAEAWRRPALLLSLVMLGPMLFAMVASVAGALTAMISGSTPDWLANLPHSTGVLIGLRLIQAAMALWLAWRQAARADHITPIALGSYAAIMLLSAASILTGWGWLRWEAEPLGMLMLVALVIIALTGDGKSGHHHGLVVALLVTLYRYREVLSEPGAVFATVSVSAVLLISLIWRVLTDAELAKGDSAGFPRDSRVLVYGAMVLLAVLTLAVSAQVRIQGAALDQTSMVSFGDRTLGGALFVASGLASLVAMYRVSVRSA